MARNIKELNDFENSMDKIMNGFSKEELGLLHGMLNKMVDDNPTLKSKYNQFLSEPTCNIKCTRKDVDIVWETLTNTEKKSVTLNIMVKLLENMSTNEVAEMLGMTLMQLDLDLDV